MGIQIPLWLMALAMPGFASLFGWWISRKKEA